MNAWPSVMGAILLFASAGADELGRRAVRVPDCVTVRGEARSSGYGYDHVVYVRNSCPTTVDCKVATNLDPEPGHRLLVPPAREMGVVTRTGSPQRTFEPKVSCKRRARAGATCDELDARGLAWMLHQ